MSNKNKKTWKNSIWINDLNHEHQKELSKIVDKMQVVPLGPKRVKLSECNDYKNSWKKIQNNDKIAESSKEECKNNTNNVVKIPSTIVVQKGKKIKTN